MSCEKLFLINNERKKVIWKNYSKKIENFITNFYLLKLGYNLISDDNIAKIMDYIIDNYEALPAQAKETGEN